MIKRLLRLNVRLRPRKDALSGPMTQSGCPSRAGAARTLRPAREFAAAAPS